MASLFSRKMHCRKARDTPGSATFYITECGLKVMESGQQLHGGTSRRMIDSLDRDLFEMRLAETRGPRPANYCSKCVTVVRGHMVESMTPPTPGRQSQGFLATHGGPPKVKTGLSPDIEKALAQIAGVEELPETAPWLTYEQLSRLAIFISSRAWLAGEESGQRFPRGEGG